MDPMDMKNRYCTDRRPGGFTLGVPKSIFSSFEQKYSGTPSVKPLSPQLRGNTADPTWRPYCA